MMMLEQVILLLLLTQSISPMYIPQDVEVMDGYDLDYASASDYYPSGDSTYLEAESMTNIGRTAIRNKRSTDDKESSKSKLDVERQRRSDKSDLPMPEKQTMDAEFYNKKGMWTTRTLTTDYSNGYPQSHTNSYDDDDDNDSVSQSSNNEGIKGRTPRVHFITQQHKNTDNERIAILPQLVQQKGKSQYQKVEPNPVNQDIYPSRSYDPYLRRYDRYDDQYNRYDPYYEDYYLYRRRYDPYDSYSPRTPSYHDSLYYQYPDHRYDIPDSRDYRSIYYNNNNNNDLYDNMLRMHQQHQTRPQRPRRIIYYAHLPEIVRKPSLRVNNNYVQRYDRNRYDEQNYIGPVSGAYKFDNAPPGGVGGKLKSTNITPPKKPSSDRE